jgi:DNA helicase-2/ATP-dependent DNA helicase PcrA
MHPNTPAPSGRGSSLIRMERDLIFADLNPEQRRAVETVRGPVCILAGAGSGKTTTITHRVANQVATATFRPDEILAVTFTDKAAAEMRSRLAGLGVTGVRAQTFHAAALGQLHAYGAGPPGVLPSKAIVLTNVARVLPRPYRFRPVGDLATEIEWAKNRRLAPDGYRASLGEHRPPIPPDLMTTVFHEYERRKAALGRVDFEDIIERAIRLFDEDDHARADFVSRFKAFTVDEYQDVNFLQQALLERWLAGRDELCVVGDDHQSIYSFIGASPGYLLEMPSRHPAAIVVRLEENYRSTPEVLSLANRLAPKLGGVEKTLRASRPCGPEPVVRAFDGPEETRFIVEQARSLHGEDGVPWHEIAVLYRTNARSAGYEQAFTEAGIPFEVREGGFLTRQAARRIRARLGRSASTAVAASVAEAATREGWLRAPSKQLGEQELVRQGDFAQLVELARAFDDGMATLVDFFRSLEERFGPDASGRGVQLLTYHRAKGLEFEAVFLPRLEEKELPIRKAKTEAEIDEERRLLYVGITRAKRRLFVSWSQGAKPSRFLRELGLGSKERQPKETDVATVETPLHAALRVWRRERARADGVPAFVVFHDTTLLELADRRPATRSELADVPGFGPVKVERYADDLLAALAAAPSQVEGPT